MPRLGDVLNYDYLFKREAAGGRDEGVKARPVTTKGEVAADLLL